MILPEELLPAAQHYSLLAIATAIYALIVVNWKKDLPAALWFFLCAMGLIPIMHMELEVIAAMSSPPCSWTNLSVLLHGVAIGTIVPVALYSTEGFKRNTPRRDRLEPRV